MFSLLQYSFTNSRIMSDGGYSASFFSVLELLRVDFE